MLFLTFFNKDSQSYLSMVVIRKPIGHIFCLLCCLSKFSFAKFIFKIKMILQFLNSSSLTSLLVDILGMMDNAHVSFYFQFFRISIIFSNTECCVQCRIALHKKSSIVCDPIWNCANISSPRIGVVPNFVDDSDNLLWKWIYKYSVIILK